VADLDAVPRARGQRDRVPRALHSSGRAAQRRHLSDDCAAAAHQGHSRADARRLWLAAYLEGVAGPGPAGWQGAGAEADATARHTGKGKRRFKVTTDSNHDLPIAPNLLNREFNVAAPDKVWAGDITYIATDEGWLFLAVVIDLFSRQVVGWSLRQDMAARSSSTRCAWRGSSATQADTPR